MSRGSTVLVVVIVLLVLAAAFCFPLLLPHKAQPKPGKTQSAAFLQHLAWRTLYQPKSFVPYLEPYPGDFDGDRNDEVAVLENYRDGLVFIGLDGHTISHVNGNFLPRGVWDCNGDGKDEVLCDAEGILPPEQAVDGEVAIDMQGRQVLTLPFNAPFWKGHGWSAMLVGDADGDGKAEWWALRDRSDLVAVKPGGTVVFDTGYTGLSVNSEGDSAAVADFDGTGRAAAACLSRAGVLHVFAMGHKAVSLTGLPPDLEITSALDCDGDGHPDLLCGAQGYIHMPAGKFVPYTLPPTSVPAADFGRAVFDLDGDGFPDQVESTSQESASSNLLGKGGWIQAFSPHRGQYIYREQRFVNGACPLQLVHTKQGDHLLVSIFMGDSGTPSPHLVIYP